jgi:hypothetical protein
MSAINQIKQLTEMIAEATVMIQKMKESMAASAAQAEPAPAPAPAPAPKVKKAKKAPVDAAAVGAAAVGATPVVKKAKKPASNGTMAWHAFVAHVQQTQPTRFTDFKKHSEVLHEASSIRDEDEDGYKTFVATWKAAHLAPESPAPAPLEEIVIIADVASSTVEPVVQKEKRKAAAGTMAWHAFVAHCKTTMPEIANISTPAEKVRAIKMHKENDKAGYETFVNEWKAAHPIA